MAHKRLGEMLIEAGFISPEKLDLALNVQKRTTERLGQIIARLGFITDDELAQTIAKQYGMRYVGLEQLKMVELDIEAIEALTLDFARTHVMLPVLRNKNPYLVVADILNTQANDRAQAYIGRRPLVLSTRTAISTVLETYAFGGKDGEKIVDDAGENIDGGELNELLGYLLGRAVLAGASDIHIEPTGPVSVVRFRVDGVLQATISLPRERHENLVNVLFGKSGIDLSDFHRLRDGRFSFGFAGRTLDVRFASSPTVEGPMVVMRILDDTRSLTQLTELGYTDWNLAAIRELVRHPFGVIVMVGPTGSGKTTTLYSILSTLNDTQKKILTVENPVEIRLPSVQQVQVNEKAGVTFANCIRGFLRQDPDIILVGEIRDEETAREAYRASNTGHLVLTTLHANSAIEAIARLVDLGLENYRVADDTLGICAQRLLRRICPKCSVPAPVDGFPEARDKGPGCGSCIGGWAGRQVVAEVLHFSDSFRAAIHERRPAAQLRQVARATGFKNMMDNGHYLIRLGETCIEEVERVVGPVLEESVEKAAEEMRLAAAASV